MHLSPKLNDSLTKTNRMQSFTADAINQSVCPSTENESATVLIIGQLLKSYFQANVKIHFLAGR